MKRAPKTGEGGAAGHAPIIAALLFAALACSIAGCAGLTGEPVATHLVPASTQDDARRAAELISRYRTAHGRSSVTFDSRLAAAAEVQARSVAAAGTLSHGDFTGRMASFDIRGVAAENLSAGRASIEDAIAGWKASPGHNENLLLAGINRIGVARIDTPGAGYHEYWALVLAQ